MPRRAANISFALALALTAINGAPARAQPDGSLSGDGLQNARQSMPKYGERGGSAYGPHDYRLGARFDYGLDGTKSSKAADAAMKTAFAHQHTADCPPLGHGVAPGVPASGGARAQSNPPKKKYAQAKPGATQRAPKNSGEKKPPANQNTPPKKPVQSGDKTTEVPQPPDILTGKKGRRDRFDVFPEPKGVDYATAGVKGGFSEVGGLELEDEPIEYRTGSSGEYHKSKQPGIPKYTNINGPRPPVDGELAKDFLREMRFQIELEDLKAKHFPERPRQSAQRRSDAKR